MSKFVLGTANFGMEYGVSPKTTLLDRLSNAESIVVEAMRNGMFTVDTAAAYGKSESVLGAVSVNGLDVITKLPSLPEDCGDVHEWVEIQIRCSLHNLKTDQLHCVMIHNANDIVGEKGNSLIDALERIRNYRFPPIRKVGVSIYDPSVLEDVFSKYRFDIVQAPLNILDRRIITSGWAEKLHNMVVELHVRSAFLQGLLLMPRDKIPAKFERWKDLWDAWHKTLESTGVTALEACLRFVANQPFVDKIVVGVENVSQLREIVAVTDRPVMDFPQWELADDDLINPYKWSSL